VLVWSGMKTAALLLAGGLSRRMTSATKKPHLLLDGVSLLDRTHALCAAMVDDVIVDDVWCDGPAAAIAACLERTTAHLLVMPVDMPLLLPSHLRALLDADDAVVAYAGSALPMAIPSASAARISAQLASGQRKLSSLIDTWLPALDADSGLNVNTPDDWARAEAISRRRQTEGQVVSRPSTAS
jgi:molybdopterin-guanine dinucleotide biosynthesis protein A